MAGGPRFLEGPMGLLGRSACGVLQIGRLRAPSVSRKGREIWRPGAASVVGGVLPFGSGMGVCRHGRPNSLEGPEGAG